MIAQEICLVNEPGAGAHYMNMYDQLPTSVRYRLKECVTNICTYCLCQQATNHRDEQELHYLIDLFEAGDYNAIIDRRTIQDSRRHYEEERLYRLYGNPYDPPINVNDFIRPLRDYDDPLGRSLQQGLAGRRRSYVRAYARSYDEPSATRFPLASPMWIGTDLAKTTIT